MKVAREETFGPVAPLFRFKTEDEGDRAGQRHRVRPRVRISTPATSAASGASPRRSNTASSASTRASSPPRCAPFGGVKESGLGREGSKYGIEEFLEIKVPLHRRPRHVNLQSHEGLAIPLDWRSKQTATIMNNERR